MRAVIDANVLISAILFPGVCRSLLLAPLERDAFTLVLSPKLLEDFFRTLEKPKIKRLLDSCTLEEIIFLIHTKAWIVDPKIRVKACRDPDDDAVIECALAAKASIIVTGDKDLLCLKTFRKISIISPRAFANRFGIT